MIQKQIIRKEMLAKRASLCEREIEEKSRAVNALLFDVIHDRFAGNTHPKTVMVYLSAHGEPCTRRLMKKLFADGHKVVVPISETKTETLILSEITPETQYKKSAYGISEPTEIISADQNKLDLIIVPGVAFDTSLNRLGHGKGYYDKLLCETKAYKIGICYDFQLMSDLPADEHDVKMDMIITDRRVIK